MLRVYTGFQLIDHFAGLWTKKFYERKREGHYVEIYFFYRYAE